MRNSVVIGAALAFVATAAVAQMPPAQSGPQNSVINTQNSSNRQVTAPVQGRNSFTQGEVRSRIEKYGYTNVTGLKKDDNGVWRGQAMKKGQQVDVSLDYQGNVIVGNNAQGTTGNAVSGTAGR
jgi:hypothetical protein